MSKARVSIFDQPASILGLDAAERDAVPVSMRKLAADQWMVVSRYGDPFWWMTGAPTNERKSQTKVDFGLVPDVYRSVMKQTTYRYLRRGRDGSKRPKWSSLTIYIKALVPFLEYLETLGIMRLSEVTPLVCTNYAQQWQERAKQGVAVSSVFKRLGAIEALYEFSQHSDDPMPAHPWPDSSANHLAGYTKTRAIEGRKTPLIPKEDFSRLFQAASKLVEQAGYLFLLRDESEKIEAASAGLSRVVVNDRKNRALAERGWSTGVKALSMELIALRTACYVVIASLSGCRNHELAFLGADSCYSSEGNYGERYYWMRSRSTKTDAGHTEWMIPEAAVTAIAAMQRWSAPLQADLRTEIEHLRQSNVTPGVLAEAQEHVGALFVGQDPGRRFIVRTITGHRWNALLREFAERCGIKAHLHTHQFRRTFANYAARSQFGDLRYLKEHFKHWSMDMTLGYALNEDQEMSLYMEIQDELDDLKEDAVAGWMSEARLAGGYGVNLVNWRARSENIVMFKTAGAMVRAIAHSTAIRSNGHAWCTSDSHECSGNDIDRLRCGDGCDNAVVAAKHIPIYDGLYRELEGLRACDDIGPGGQARVERDVARCRKVLSDLGHDPAGVAS